MSQCAQSLEWESSNALKKASLDTQHQGLNRLGFIYLVHTVQRRKTAPRRRQSLGSEGTLFEEKPKKTLIVFYVWKGTSNTDGPHVFWIPYQLNICVIYNIYIQSIYIYKEKKYVYNIIHLYNILRMIFIYHHNWYHCFSCLWPLTMQPWCACEATCQQLQSCQQRQGLNTMGPWDFDKSQGEHCCEIATRWFKKSGMGCCLEDWNELTVI